MKNEPSQEALLPETLKPQIYCLPSVLKVLGLEIYVRGLWAADSGLAGVLGVKRGEGS